MKIWRDKSGKWIDAKEFGIRFKKGVASVKPIQQTSMQILFTWITVIGIMCGIVVCIITIKTLWWLLIILVAALGNTFVGLLGTYQKYLQLKKIEAMIKEEHSGL